MNCTHATMNKSIIIAYVYNLFTFFIWIALGYVDLCFSLMLVRKANTVKEETQWAVWLYHQHNQSIQTTNGMAVMSLSASFLQKISAATDHLCQIMLNLKLLHNSEKRCKFSSHNKKKLRKSRNNCSDCYSGLELWTWHHEQCCLISGQNLLRKHTDPVTKHESAFISTDHHMLDVQFIANLRVKFVHSFNHIEHNRKSYLTQQNWLALARHDHFSPVCFSME